MGNVNSLNRHARHSDRRITSGKTAGQTGRPRPYRMQNKPPFPDTAA